MRASPSFRAFPAGVLAGFLTLSAFASGTARAQDAYEPDLLLPPRAVVWRLSDRGFTEITRPRFDGRAYIVEASNPYGDRVRLFVDASTGRILGRESLDAPAQAPARLVRPGALGYGWTEEDDIPRRPMREAERILPPADIPFPPGQPRRPRPDPAVRPSPISRPDLALRPDGAARPEGIRSAQPARPEPADRNPMGLNPDARGPEAAPKAEAPRKVVRLNPTTKPPAPSGTSVAPKLSDVPPALPPGETGTGAANAPVAPPQAKSAARGTTPATSMTPASVQPPPAEKPSAQNWKDVPPDAKRPVRVIGGATLVPGATKDAD